MKIGPRLNYGVARQLPLTIPSLRHPCYRNMSDEELYNESEEVMNTIKFSEDDAKYLAEVTKLQSDSFLWFEHRKGRITVGAVCRTSTESPSRSVIEAILQVKKMPKVPAFEWGQLKEDTARKAYISAVSHRHKSFGLHLHTYYYYLGASPDDLVSCSCCGPGLLKLSAPIAKEMSIQLL